MAESVIEKAKKHFLDHINDIKCVKVPEWDAEIYFKPLSLSDQDRIYKYVQKGSLESIAETLIVRSLNKDGSKMFTSANKTELMRMVDPDIMNKIVMAMADDNDETLEEIVGN